MDMEAFRHVLFAILVTSPRIVAAFGVIPFMGKQILHGMTRNSIVLSFAIPLFPMVLPGVPKDMPALPLLAAVILKEAIVGLMLGFVAGIIFWAAESVGYFIDNQRGATMANVFDPMTGTQTSPLGSLLLQLTAVLFFAGGGFLVLLSAIYESYRLWPIFSFFPRFDAGFSEFFLGQADLLMQLTVLLGGPIVIALFVSEMGLGLINRFAPQLNVFFLSMPIKSGIAIFLLILYLTFLVSYFGEEIVRLKALTNLIGDVMSAPGG